MSNHEETRPPHQRAIPLYAIEAVLAHTTTDQAMARKTLEWATPTLFTLLHAHRITPDEACDLFDLIASVFQNALVASTFAKILKGFNDSETTDDFGRGLARAIHSMLGDQQERSRLALIIEHIGAELDKLRKGQNQ